MRLTESFPYWLFFYHKQFPAKKGSGHKTNKAFDRYVTIDDDDSRLLYADALPQKVATILQPKKLHSKNGKLLKLKG